MISFKIRGEKVTVTEASVQCADEQLSAMVMQFIGYAQESGQPDPVAWAAEELEATEYLNTNKTDNAIVN